MQGQPVSRGNQADANVLRKHKYTSMTLHDAATMLGGEAFAAMITEFISANRELKQDECWSRSRKRQIRNFTNYALALQQLAC